MGRSGTSLVTGRGRKAGPGLSLPKQGSDDRNRANRGGNEQAAGDEGTDDRNAQLLKIVRNRHCLSPDRLSDHSVSHARMIAAAVPVAENGGKPPILENPDLAGR